MNLNDYAVNNDRRQVGESDWLLHVGKIIDTTYKILNPYERSLRTECAYLTIGTCSREHKSMRVEFSFEVSTAQPYLE